MRPQIKATTNHPFNDPWTNKHEMFSRVAKGSQLGWFVWIWHRDGAGYVYTGDDENTQRLLDEEPCHDATR